MAWLSQFKLGRPGYEVLFDINPEGMGIEEMPVDVQYRNIAGDLKRSIIKVSTPNIVIDSNYLLKAQRDQFASMAGITDVFLSFQTRDDWQVLMEYDLPASTTSVVIQNTSATKLDQALVAAGFSSQITILGVWNNPAGTGTNYFTGGSYASATRTIALGSTLSSSTAPVYVSYTYKGWLVMMKSLSHSVKGGWADRFQYSFELTGV